ncbi:MAG: hypothetical protein P1U65_07550 [Minwuia sp.]|nr:hypothetical protein [Minwuia sp.]
MFLLGVLSTLSGFACLVIVGVLLAVVPMGQVLRDMGENPFSFATFAGPVLLMVALVPVGFTAIIAGVMAQQSAEQDKKRPRDVQKKSPASTTPAEPNLKPRDEG